MMEGIGQLNYYVRDASGKVLAIYNGDSSQAEVPIYGASRLGIRFNDELTSYQLSDHLGNVRATVRWSGVSRSINNYSDFYPFGMKIGYQTDGKYRYGYQGEFAEDETDETGFNSFEARMYDPVIGRWMSVDPARQYASGYVGMGNNPILRVDSDGRTDHRIDLDSETGAVNLTDTGDNYNHEFYVDGILHSTSTSKNAMTLDNFSGVSWNQNDMGLWSLNLDNTLFNNPINYSGEIATVVGNTGLSVASSEIMTGSLVDSKLVSRFGRNGGYNPIKAVGYTDDAMVPIAGIRATKGQWGNLAKGLGYTGSVLGTAGILVGAYQYKSGQISGLEFGVDTVIGGAGVLAGMSLFAPPVALGIGVVGVAYFGTKAGYYYYHQYFGTGGRSLYEDYINPHFYY